MMRWLHTPLIFRLRELVEDPHEDNRLSLTKAASILAVVTMSIVFWKNSVGRNIDWMDFVGYAVGMSLAPSPALVSKFIGVRWGGTVNGNAKDAKV